MAALLSASSPIAIIYGAKLTLNTADMSRAMSKPEAVIELLVDGGEIDIGVRLNDGELSPINPEFRVYGELAACTMKIRVDKIERQQ